jgi:hypothetical protein
MESRSESDPFLREKDGRMLDLGTFGGTCGVVGLVRGR